MVAGLSSVSRSEEPGAVIPHAGICERRSGDWLFYLDSLSLKDSRVVVLHDETLDRTTDGTGPVTEFTLEELKKLNTGIKEKIPTYEEVLELVSNTGTKLLLVSCHSCNVVLHVLRFFHNPQRRVDNEEIYCDTD